jgi:hypothetical protein
VVDADGSQLILGARVSQCASDRNELVADIAAIPTALGRPETVLADNGYANGDEVESLAERGIEALVATGAEGRGRRHDFRPTRAQVPAKEPKADWLKAMAGKLASEQGRTLYKLRQQTVEPVFGIIKAVLGFRGFSLRGQGAARARWPGSGIWSRWPTTASACTSSSWRAHRDRRPDTAIRPEPPARPAAATFVRPIDTLPAVSSNLNRSSDRETTQHNISHLKSDRLLARISHRG